MDGGPTGPGQEVPMLILRRKVGETVVLGNTIRVTVVEVSSGAVRLAFEAPTQVSIYREEIHKEIAEVNRLALGDVPAEPQSVEPAPRVESGSAPGET